MHMNTYSEATTSQPMPPTMDEDLENNTEDCNNAMTPMVRKKSELVVVTNNDSRFQMLRNFMTNLQEVIFGTKLVVLFPAVPLAVVANFYSFGRKQADVNSLLLLLGLLCHLLPLLFKYALGGGNHSIATSTLQLSRASSIVMLLAYVAYIFFQLKTHRKLFDAQEVDEEEEKAVIGFWSAFTWLVGMTLVISLLSEYVVGTIEVSIYA
ncbi:hypothetical protein JHK85_041334 [Glycine max]|nr:hypothetical protein JHK85_041334 [Glycine max]